MNYTGVVFPRIKAVFQLGVEWHDWREFRNSQSNDGSDNVCYLDTYVFSLRYGKHRYFKNRGSHLTTRSAFDKEIGNGSCIPAVRSIIPVVNNDDGFSPIMFPLHIDVDTFTETFECSIKNTSVLARKTLHGLVKTDTPKYRNFTFFQKFENGFNEFDVS